MRWIEPGPLLAGTAVGKIPRIADEEMPGVQVMLQGFFMDRFAYPNEEGAIPTTGVSQPEAEQLCAQQNKRLCTELEWERSCKGSSNRTYEYGEEYRPEACQTGRAPRMLPSGYRAQCVSEFGVSDMHGGVWEWTRSRWARGSKAQLFSLRGGNAEDGELVGRCANAMGRPPKHRSPQVGFRCCRGEVNQQKVQFKIERGSPLRTRYSFSSEVAERLRGAIPGDIKKELARYGKFQLETLWRWRPLGNEELMVGGGCAGNRPRRRCGVVVTRMSSTIATFLAWMWVGKFPPVAKVRGTRRRLWIYGGDRVGHYKHALWFEWGRVREGELVRNKSR